MWSGFDPRHMWESWGFSPRTPVFPSPQIRVALIWFVVSPISASARDRLTLKWSLLCTRLIGNNSKWDSAQFSQCPQLRGVLRNRSMCFMQNDILGELLLQSKRTRLFVACNQSRRSRSQADIACKSPGTQCNISFKHGESSVGLKGKK